jgi:ferredoxin-NADP reductase
MLQYIREEDVLPRHSKIEVHYLIRLRKEALFANVLYEIKHQLAGFFEAHIWITRQESTVVDPSPLPEDSLTVHNHVASNSDQVGESWKWWDTFSSKALEHFDTKETRTRSLVYICGPQGLTDRLVEMYKEKGMHTEDGHVQVEKWW